MIAAIKDSKKKKKPNLSLLPESISSYRSQFIYYVQEPILQYFQKLFLDCKTANAQADSLALFRCYQSKLQSLKTVDAKTVHAEVTAAISPSVPLHDIMKLILVSECILLGSVRPKSEDTKQLEMNVPTIQEFMYQMVLSVAQSIYGLPTVITVLSGDTEKVVVWKRQQVTAYIQHAFEQTVRKNIPICDLIKQFGRHFEATEPEVRRIELSASAAAPAKKEVAHEGEGEGDGEAEAEDDEDD